MSANPREPGEVEEANSELGKHISLVGLLQTLKATLSQNVEGNPEYSLLAHVKRKCTEGVANDEVYLVNVAPRALIPDSGIPDGEVDPNTHDIQNAYEVVQEYLSQPKAPRPGSASPEDDSEWLPRESAFEKCYESVADVVVQEASILACTQILLACILSEEILAQTAKV